MRISPRWDASLPSCAEWSSILPIRSSSIIPTGVDKVGKTCYNTYMNLNNVDEEWFRRDRSFRIIGNDQVGYHVRACGNHRALSDRDTPLKTLQDARNWLTEYYPGVIIHTPAIRWQRNVS